LKKYFGEKAQVGRKTQTSQNESGEGKGRKGLSEKRTKRLSEVGDVKSWGSVEPRKCMKQASTDAKKA